jgi:hypothetical protein
MKIVFPKHALVVHDKVHACKLIRNKTKSDYWCAQATTVRKHLCCQQGTCSVAGGWGDNQCSWHASQNKNLVANRQTHTVWQGWWWIIATHALNSAQKYKRFEVLIQWQR